MIEEVFCINKSVVHRIAVLDYSNTNKEYQQMYLYIKTHNKTNLKYLGKTEQDPLVYKGSGVYWTNHLRKHGNDVTTEVIFESESKEKIKEMGLYYSDKFDVVKSNEWANLIEENGCGGVPTNAFPKGHIPWSKGRKLPEVSRKLKENWARWRLQNPDYKDKWKKYEKIGFSGEERQSRSTRIADINKQKIQCPHCDKQGNNANMKRWHFDNCKVK